MGTANNLKQAVEGKRLFDVIDRAPQRQAHPGEHNRRGVYQRHGSAGAAGGGASQGMRNPRRGRRGQQEGGEDHA